MNKRSVYKEAAKLIENGKFDHSCNAIFYGLKDHFNLALREEYSEWGRSVTGINYSCWLTTDKDAYYSSEARTARVRILRAFAAGRKDRAEKILREFVKKYP